MKASTRVAVIGGGIGGLTLGIELQKMNFQVTVYETQPAGSTVGSGITLAPNALKILNRLGLGESLMQIGQPQSHGTILWEDGKVLRSMDMRPYIERFGFPLLAFHRSELIQCLSQALHPESLRHEERVESFQEHADHVQIVTRNGEFQYDLVILCDGIHSHFRSLVMPKSPVRYSGQTSWRGLSDGATSDGAEIWSQTPGLRFGYVPLRGGKTYFYATQLAPKGLREESQLEAKRNLLELFKNFPEPVVAILRKTEPKQILRTDIEDLKPTGPWSKGRIALLGDSAHATTPNLGQGACQAIESAAVLAYSLQKHETPAEVFQFYEAERRPRAKFITDSSWNINLLLNLRGSLGHWARRYAMKAIPARVRDANFMKIYSGIRF